MTCGILAPSRSACHRTHHRTRLAWYYAFLHMLSRYPPSLLYSSRFLRHRRLLLPAALCVAHSSFTVLPVHSVMPMLVLAAGTAA